MKLYKQLSLCMLFVVLLIVTSCNGKKDQQKEYFEESGTVFHTFYHIKYEAEKPLTDSIAVEFEKFNNSLNPFKPTSIISKVNRNEPVVLDEWFTDVFLKAQEVSRNTNGVFDITCAPLVNAWGFGFSKMDSVTPQRIDSLKQYVGYQKIELKDRQITKDNPGIILNTSAIAKGYASDVIADLLVRNGVSNYMVEIGGEVTVNGKNPKGECWKIGINKPEDDRSESVGEIQEVVQICKGGLATSGNYRNFYIKNGKKYAHTIDPRTGYPSEQNILSATIIAPTCMMADAYATAFMAMGLEQARIVAGIVPDIQYYIIYTDENGDMKTDISKGMLEYLPQRKELNTSENK